ncbi:MAG TPA: hypothetical protein VIZ28_18740 [Chitinophagaceae bacterium]
MPYVKKISALPVALFIAFTAFSQYTGFSISTDVNVIRSFKEDQQYWAIGQTAYLHFHLSPKNGFYVWAGYSSDGEFTNELTATAKSGATTPQDIPFNNNAAVRYKHLSMGWKRYLKGAANSEKWNLYGYAGLGIMLGKVVNTHEPVIDTAVYSIPVYEGKANFKRLTLDTGLGVELHMGANIYFYLEGRILIPTSDYPSKYLLVNEDAPLVGSANAGIRILFY